MNIDYPYHFDRDGRTARTEHEDHVRDMVEQVLLTSPGERVNRPTFGSGVAQLVFEPNSQAMSAAVEVAVQGSLQQWLGDLIEVESIGVESADATIRIGVRYVLRRTGTRVEQRVVRST